MIWKTETINGKETHQLHVRVERLVVEQDGDRWKWTALDGAGAVVASAMDGSWSKYEARVAAIMWLRDYADKLDHATSRETPLW